jgi:uncharacterized protein YjbI with pentapeptide repeats/beta-lactamase regulating signal transducer with metallopeptidase domain
VTLLFSNGFAFGSALAHALFDGIWVGAVVALALHIYLLRRRDLSAASRHAAWYTALLCVAALPLLSFTVSLGQVSVQPDAAAMPIPLVTAAAHAAGTHPLGHAPMSLEAPGPASAVVARFTTLLNFASRALPAVAIAVALVAFMRMGTLLAALFGLARVKRESRVVDASMAPRLARAFESDPGARRIQVRISDTLDAPAAAGFRRPAILLPAGLVESVAPDALEQIVMHEYAHLRRYDDWTNLIARVVERLYWFNPAVWFISARVDLERELACDDWAVADADGVSGYADCLWRLAHDGRTPAFAATAPGAFLTRNQVVARIEHLLERRRESSRAPRAAKLLAFAPVLVAAFVLAAGRAPAITLHVPQPAPPVVAIAPIHANAVSIAKTAAVQVSVVSAAPVVDSPHISPPAATAAIQHVTAPRTPMWPAAALAPKPQVAAATHAAQIQRASRTVVRVLIGEVRREHMHEHLAVKLSAIDQSMTGAPVQLSNASFATAETLADAASTQYDSQLAAADESDNSSPAQIDRNILAHCSGCDLSGKDLRGADLHGLALSGDDLSDADLRGANLRGTIFTGVDLSNAKLDGADLRNAVLTGSEIDGATFAGAKTDGIKLIGMQLNDSILATVSVRWIVSNCAGCDLSGLDLHGRDLHDITLSGADLSHADLRGVNFSGARLNGVDLEDANLDGADLTNAQLNGCDLQGATLDHARTQGMTLEGSDISDLGSGSGTDLNLKMRSSDSDDGSEGS